MFPVDLNFSWFSNWLGLDTDSSRNPSLGSVQAVAGAVLRDSQSSESNRPLEASRIQVGPSAWRLVPPLERVRFDWQSAYDKIFEFCHDRNVQESRIKNSLQELNIPVERIVRGQAGVRIFHKNNQSVFFLFAFTGEGISFNYEEFIRGWIGQLKVPEGISQEYLKIQLGEVINSVAAYSVGWLWREDCLSLS